MKKIMELEILKTDKGTRDSIVRQAIANPQSSIRALTKGSLYYFIKYFWPEYSQDTFQGNWHIKYICEELEIVARRVAKNKPKLYDLIINVPPGTTKTAIVSIFFPLWCWVNSHKQKNKVTGKKEIKEWYHLRFITASYTAPLSLESAEYSREVVRSERFKQIFPDIEIKDDKDTKSNFRVVKNVWYKGPGYVPRKKTGGNRFSTSVGGSVTGFHGHINIVDDPIDPLNAISEAGVNKANHWMDNTLPFRKVDKKVTVTIVIMQRLHQDDPTGHLLKLDEGINHIKHICLPGEIRNYRERVKPPELVKYYVDDLLDPNRLGWNELNDFLKLGQFTYGGQVGQDPVPLGGGMFKTDNLVHVERAPALSTILETVRYWDKAGTQAGGAWTVGLKMCKCKDGTFTILDLVRGRWATEKRERIIRQTAEADGYNVKVYVEQEPGSGGLESADATIKNLAGYTAFKDRPTGDKVYRADPFSVQMNNGNVRMLTAGWNKEMVDEYTNFPNSTFKDQVDAGSGAFQKLTKLKRVTVARR